MSTAVMADVVGGLPQLSVSVTAPGGGPTYNASASSIPFGFDAAVTFFDQGPPGKADLYYGVIAPSGDVISLVPGKTDAIPELGMVPLATDLDTSKAANLSVGTLVGQRLQYTFTGNEQFGVYSVFALLVKAGGDPAATQNWLTVDMKPLIVTPGAPVPNVAGGTSLLTGTPLEQYADALITFTPSQDTQLISTEDQVLVGSVVSVWGPVPNTIIIPAHTLIRALQTGVPVDMYLMLSPDGNSYRPIAIFGH
jgi:hypothetical protein